jgi:hypothetical protein
MPATSDHIIRKATVNLQFNRNTDGLALQQEFTEWVRNRLNPSIEAILSEFDQVDETLSVDNIRLDIAIDFESDWQNVLIEKIAGSFRQKLHASLTLSEGSAVKKSKTASFLITLKYYLKFGVLPWTSTITSKKEFRTVLDNWLETAYHEQIRDLLEILPENDSFSRFINLLTPKQVVTFSGIFISETKEKISAISDDLLIIHQSLTNDQVKQNQILHDFKQFLIGLFVSGYKPEQLSEPIGQWIKTIQLKYADNFLKINPEIIKTPEIAGIMLKLTSASDLRSHNRKADKYPGNKNILHYMQNQTSVKDLTYKAEKFSKEFLEELGTGIFINNAGAVIVAPFLPMLYSRLKIVNGDSLSDESKALSLLHYCITGLADPEEFELLLPKILCGIPPERFVETGQVTAIEMLKEADEMLLSVIEYWSVLKNTSPDGLREGFLQRKGKLIYANNEWNLIVEQKSHDILLHQLPWNISMIRLPWMKNILKVTWI